MTVKEFKKLVAAIPDDMDRCEVFMSSDPEGNSYHALRCVNADSCARVDDYEVSVYSNKWSAYDACFDSETEWEKFKKENRCVVLSP